MAASVRSPNGCWTCRLRKKKCDETKPSCLLCNSLLLTCYGYGPKPQWMDGGVEESEIATDIRRRVKQETSRKKKLRIEAKRNLDGLPERTSVKLDEAATTKSLDAHLKHKINYGGHNSTIFPSPVGKGSSSNDSASAGITLEEEEGLLMHYLDYVFPLQFRFYQPSPLEGGRGWLLSILLRTKPLYYAAITLSAFHRQYMTCTGAGRNNIRCDMDRLLSRYAAAIKELRLFIAGFGTGSLPDTLPELVEILACTVILISLELFNGNGANNWQVHLQAATSLIPTLQTKSMIRAHPELSTVYKSALYFFGGVLAWYDILSFATTKAKPSTMYPCLGSGRGNIQLEKVMGCENWAMLIILDIAILNERKETLAKTGQFSLRQLEHQGGEIEQRLAEGLAINAVKEHDVKDIQTVTHIFACSALVYLHVVVSGANPQLSTVKSAVGRTIEAFRSLPDPGLIRYLIWPFCITACMATEEHQSFFTEISIPKFGMSLRAMEIVHECWRLRDCRTSGADLVDWSMAMRSLGHHIILV